MKLAAFILLFGIASAPAANLMPNSSFEVGAARGYTQGGSSYNAKRSPKDHVTSADAYDGAFSFVVERDNDFRTPPVFLTNGIQYAFSWYEKGNEANSMFYDLIHQAGGSTVVDGGTVTSPTTWTRRSFTYTPTTNDWFCVSISHFQGSLNLYVDAFQIEVGASATVYEPMNDVEIGLDNDQERFVMFTGDTKAVDLKWWNAGSETNKVAQYEVYNLWNEKVANGFVTATIPATGRLTNSISLPDLNGWMRVVARITDEPNSRSELGVSVMPWSEKSGMDADGILGTHAANDAYHMAFLRKMGYTSNRTLSPSSAFRWSVVEASEGVFNWAAADALTNQYAQGIHILGDLQGGLDGAGGPAWAHVGGDPDAEMDMAAWSNFCYTAVSRYKTTIPAWEIWNEPQQNGTPWIGIATNYASMCEHAIGAIYAADPTAEIFIGGGSIDQTWVQTVWDTLTATAQSRVTGFSGHRYPKDNQLAASGDPNVGNTDSWGSDWRTQFADEGLELWNTETGSWGQGGLLTDAASGLGFAFWDPVTSEIRRDEPMTRSPISIDRETINFARCVGHGFTKYYYYDSRPWNFQAWLRAYDQTQPYSWEHNGGVRPKLTALAILADIVDGYTAVTRPTNSVPQIELYVFERASDTVAVAFNADRLTRDITTAETDFTVYDQMRNVVTQPSGKIRLTKSPQYIWTTNTPSWITTVLQGSASTVADPNAPNLSVDVAPTGEWAGGSVKVKWTAIDREVENWDWGTSNGTNILYAWKFDSDAYTSYSVTNYIQPTISSGDHTLWVRALDANGNESEISYQFVPVQGVAPASGSGRRLPPRGRIGGATGLGF